MKKPKIIASVSNRIRLPVRKIPPRLRDKLEALFTFPNPEYQTQVRFSPWGAGAKTPAFIELWDYEKDGRFLTLPRGFDPEDLPPRLKAFWDRLQWRDRRVLAPVEFPPMRLTPNREQEALLSDFRRANRRAQRPFGTFLYVSGTSTGKTIFQALAATQAKQRTLVLFPTNLIKRAWYDDLKALFGLTAKDIGLIQAGHWSIGDQFTFASIATLGRRKARWGEINRLFGTLVIDEAHRITNPTLFRFVSQSPAAFRLGATATPHEDNFRLFSLLGQPKRRLYTKQRNTKHSMALTFVRTVDTEFKYEYDPINLNWHDLSDHLSCDELRNTLIVEKCIADWAQGESLLIVTKRVAHVELLVQMLRDVGIEGVNKITGETNSNQNYTSKLVQATLDRKTRCIVATIQAVKEGANLNPVSRLHLAMPVVQSDDLEQLCGRIRRRAKDKKNCGLVYYLDSEVRYLAKLYSRSAVPVFRKLHVKGFQNIFIA